VRFIRRSQPSARTPDLEVVLLDTLGELLDFYAMGDVAFVGGTLVEVGGHNLLEPAALGLPVLAGPHNFNSADIAKILVERGAALIVADAKELATRVAVLLSNPVERARIGALGRECVEDNRGALNKLLGLIDPLMRQ
jgi:3-deoxy-D-manno-octulosonic-acid transferase